MIRIKKGDIVYYGGGLGRIIYIPPSRSYVTIRPLGSKFAMSWSWKFIQPFTEEDLKYTPPHQLKHLRRKCRKDSELVKRRCCRNCMHFKPKDSTCQEGGFSEIGDQDRKLTPEDCRAFTMR